MDKFLFVTDGHLSTKRPIARVEKTDEEYINNQLQKRIQLFEYAKSKNINTIIDGGDFFQYWRMDNSNELLIEVINLFDRYNIDYYVNIGNHDLPFHNLEFIHKSLLGLLQKVNVIHIEPILKLYNSYIRFFNYGEKLVDDNEDGKFKIAVVHENIFEKNVPPYMAGYTAKELIELLPSYELFLCGHNHEQFIYKAGEQIVVNGGSVMRITTKQNDYKPMFYEIELSDKINVVSHKFDVLPNMISDEHLRNKKIETFVESTQEFADGTEIFDFRRDVEITMNKEKTIDKVREVVYKMLGD